MRLLAGLLCALSLGALGIFVAVGHSRTTVSQPAPREPVGFRHVADGYAGHGDGWSASLVDGTLRVTPAPTSGDVAFGQATFECDGVACGTGPIDTHLLGTGELELRRGDVVERLTPGVRGLEQSWRFEAAPQARGTLRVSVPVSGRLARADEAGLHFGGGAVGVTYGHGTWVDADGLREPVEARWANGAIVLEVPAAVIARSRFPAVLDPVISSEFLLSTPQRRGYALPIDNGELAYNGTNFLAVWVEEYVGFGTKVRAGRITPAGAPLELYPPELGDGSFDAISTRTAVASNGSDFLAVWEQNAAIVGVRVSSTGAVLDATPLVIANPGTGAADLPVIGWNGTSYLVAWQDSRLGANRIFANRVTPAGAVLDTARGDGRGFLVSSTASIQLEPGLACASSDCLVAWSDSRNASTDVYGVRISSAGARVDATDVALNSQAAGASEVSLAWNGATYLMVWHDVGPTQNVLAARISATLGVTDPMGVTVATGVRASGISNNDTHVTAVGSNFVVTWFDFTFPGSNSFVFGARLSGTASVLNPGAVLCGPYGRNSAVGSDGTKAFALFTGPGAFDAALIGNHINGATGAIENGMGYEVSTRAAVEATPAVAFNGTNYLAAWWTPFGVRATRVTPSGTVLDPANLVVSTNANQGPNLGLDVAWAGSHFVVVFSEVRTTNGVFVTRITPGGAVLDLNGVAVTNSLSSQLYPAVASNGTEAIVLYELGSMGDIYAVRIGGFSGTLNFSFPFLVNSGATNNAQYRPDIAWNATANSYLAVWLDGISPNAVVGSNVFPGGSADLAKVIALSPAPAALTHPVAVAPSGPNFLVSWLDSSGRISAREIVASTVPTTAFSFVPTSGPVLLSDAGTALALSSDGTNVLAAWAPVSGPSKTVAQRIAPGVVPVGTAFPVQTSGTRGNPGLASAGARRWILASDDGDGVPGEMSLVRAVTLSNATPVANANAVSTNEDTPLPITLTATDSDFDSLTYTVVAMPTHGTFTGTPPTLSYQPAANYFGPDAFTFKANDGVVDSNVATVTITVNAVNDAPVANGQSGLTVNEDTPLPITLTGSDIEGSALTFITAAPSHGTLTPGTGASRTYTPAANYNGPDSFTFVVNDGLTNSVTSATVSITVLAVNDAPVANPVTVNGSEDTSVVVTLNGTDVDSPSLTYLFAMPTKGALSGTAPNLTYTPALNTNGPDSFTYTVNDGTLTSASGTVSVSINPVNDAPLAQGQSVATQEDTDVSITVTGTDVDGDTLTFFPQGNPTNGMVAGTLPNVTYHPNPNFNGTDSFTFYVRDSALNSNVATVTVTVNPVNDAPTATSTTVTTNEDTAFPIVLAGVDPENSPLTFTVLVQPSHGTLSGTAPNLIYTPAANYSGNDTFTFKVNDGTFDSPTPGTISVNVVPVNDAPVAQTQSRSTALDTPLTITLVGTDVEGSSLTFSIVSAPTHGMLTGTGATRIYTPDMGYRGIDTFTFKVNDGQLDSAPAQVTISAGSLNSAPVATPQTLSTPEDTALAITLSATDADPMPMLTYSVLSAPMHGTLMGTPPMVSYLPSANYTGPDAFTFRASDGLDDSNTATISLTVTPVNDLPVAQAQSVATSEDMPLQVTLVATDLESSTLTYRISTMPTNGSLTGTPPTVTYTPNPNFDRQDTFAFVANDGTADSAPATVTVTILAVNDAPVATPQTVSLAQDMMKPITLAGTDIDSTSLTFSIGAPPAHGMLTGSPPNVTYQPSTGYRGADSFTFKVNDGMLDSANATVDLSITAGNSPPIVQSQTVPVLEDTPVNLSVSGVDPDGTTLTWSIAVSPSHGAVAINGTAPNYTYTPVANFNGADSFAVEASDGQATSRATINLSVTPVNDRPRVEAIAITTERNVPVDVVLKGSDVDLEPLTYEVKVQPAHGTLAGSGENLTYTPAAGYVGADSFGYVANDGTIDSTQALVDVTVTPVGGGATPRDTAQLNGWSCGCQSGSGGAGVMLCLAVLGLRRRRRALTGLAVAALVVLSLPSSAQAVPRSTPKTSKPKSTPPPPVPAPEPAPIVTAPMPVLIAPPAPAPTPTRPGPPSLVVLDVGVTVVNEKLDAAALYDVLASAVEQSKLFKVIGSKDVVTLIGVERQRQLLGCSESECFAELAGALGAQYVLEGTVGRVGTDYVVTTRLLDTKNSRLAGRGTVQTADPNLLLHSMWRTCQEALDAAALLLPPDEAKVWKERPREEPEKAVAPPTSQFGVAVSALGGVQPLAEPGKRVTVGGEVDVSLRIARFDLGAGLIISPVLGVRLFASFALLSAGPNRLSIALRGSGFPGSSAYGGGLGVSYEFSFNRYIAAQAGVATDLYSGGAPVIVALLGSAGVAAHF